MNEGEILYGINPILEALKAGRQKLNKILIGAGRPRSTLRNIEHLARSQGIPVEVCPREILNRVARNFHHQGVVAYPASEPYIPFADLLKFIRSQTGRMRLLILDGIEDPQNFGSLLRTADACGVLGVIIPKDRAVGVTPAVFKASAGAAIHVKIARVTNLASTLEELKKEKFWIVGADARGKKSLYEMKFDMNVGLVIGSEGKGIRPLVLKRCDFTVSIPMRGKISSLNTGVAGAVMLFEMFRQQVASKPP